VLPQSVYNRGVMQRLAGLFLQHRRLVARLILGFGLIAVGRQLWPTWPHETELEFELGADHAQVVELRVAYLDREQREELRGVSFGFPNGAPAVVRHHLSLPAGKVVLRCELRERNGGSRRVTRTLKAPATGVVHVGLTAADPADQRGHT
jgi:hypothetical protein